MVWYLHCCKPVVCIRAGLCPGTTGVICSTSWFILSNFMSLWRTNTLYQPMRLWDSEHWNEWKWACIENQQSVIHCYKYLCPPLPPRLARHYSKSYGYSNELDQQLQTFSLKCQIVNILDCVGLTISGATIQFCYFLPSSSHSNIETNIDCVLRKLDLY